LGIVFRKLKKGIEVYKETSALKIEDPRSKLEGIFDPNLVFSYFNAR
jgi:hypothetical protein